MKRGRGFRKSEERGRKTPAPKMPGIDEVLGSLPQALSVAIYWLRAQIKKTIREARMEEDSCAHGTHN